MQKTLQLLIVLSLVLAGLTTAQAQNDNTGKISGKVTDKDNGSAIQSASIKLLSAKDSTIVTGTETDANGAFTLEKVPYGTYSVLVELTGYSKAYARGVTLDGSNTAVTLDLTLKSGATTTEEIVIESEKSDIELKPDRRVFNVEKNLNVTGGSAIDVLKNIPSVSVDVDGNVTLRGNSNVKIIVDGKPFGVNSGNMNTMLEQIPANQISSIELITNPGAKFDAEGASGIINIVMKKNDGVGYNGNFTLNAGTRDKYNGSFNLNVKNKGLNLFGSYDYRLNNFFIERVPDAEDHVVERHVMDYVINHIDDPIGTLVKKAGYSYRHLIHLFRNYTGLTPKVFQQVKKFAVSINEISLLPTQQLSNARWKHNYFDDAHFIRQFNRFSGFTPSDYLKTGNTCARLVFTNEAEQPLMNTV